MSKVKTPILPRGWKRKKDSKGNYYYVGPNNKTRKTVPPGTKYKWVEGDKKGNHKTVTKRGKKYKISELTSVSFINAATVDDPSVSASASSNYLTILSFPYGGLDNKQYRPIRAAINQNIDTDIPVSYLPEIRSLNKNGQVKDNDAFLIYGQDVNDEKPFVQWTPNAIFTKGMRVAYLGEIYEANTNIKVSNPPVSFRNKSRKVPGWIYGFAGGVSISVERVGNSSWKLVEGQNGLYRYDSASDLLKRISVGYDIQSYANLSIVCQSTNKAYISDEFGSWDESTVRGITVGRIYGDVDITDAFTGDPIFKLSDASIGQDPPEWSASERYRGSYLSNASNADSWVPGSVVAYQGNFYACIADFWIGGSDYLSDSASITPDNEEYWQPVSGPGVKIETTGIYVKRASETKLDNFESLVKVFASLRPAKIYNIYTNPPQKPLASVSFSISSNLYRESISYIVGDDWDSETSYIENDVVEYGTGTYIATYIAIKDGLGKNPSAYSDFWTITDRLSVSNKVFSTNYDVKFSLNTIGVDMNNAKAYWDFGDGDTAEGLNVTHQFLSGNTDIMQFNVTATILAATGEKFFTSKEILVERMDQIILGIPIVVGEPSS